MDIIKSSKKAGVRTDRIDPEPYFFRWESCVPVASVDQPELVGQPCYKHKTCGHLIKVPKNRIPPMVCPWCKSDTKKEAIQQKQAEAQGVVIFDAKQRVINLKKETFNEVIDAIAEFQQPD